MSTCDFAFASKSIGESGAVFTLNGSYIPRASSVGETPLAGSAHTNTPHATGTTANTIPTPTALFIAPSPRKQVRARRYRCRDHTGNEQRAAKSFIVAHSAKLSLHRLWRVAKSPGN